MMHFMNQCCQGKHTECKRVHNCLHYGSYGYHHVDQLNDMCLLADEQAC